MPTPAEPPAGGRPGGRSDATASYDDRVPAPARLHVAAFADLDAATLYALLRLRVDVFVVEQRCPYPELDGRDTEPATRHLWLELSRTPVAYLRILAEPDGAARIGRVVVAPPYRGRGYAGRLLQAAHAHVGDRPCVLAAQAHLAGFYARYGYRVTGPPSEEDIPHVPMLRTPPAPASGGPASPAEQRRQDETDPEAHPGRRGDHAGADR